MLAGLPPNRYLATKALAEFHDVPKKYFSRTLQSLSRAGPTGGYRLARPSDRLETDVCQPASMDFWIDAYEKGRYKSFRAKISEMPQMLTKK